MPELLTTKEFGARISVGYTKARQLMESQDFIRNGITVRTNPPNMRGGKRVDWSKYEKIYLNGYADSFRPKLKRA